MRILARVLSAVLAVSLLAAPQAAVASSAAPATHRSVGTRLDSPLAPSKSKAMSRVPYLVPDQAAFGRAKREAARHAAGPAPLARSDFGLSATPSSRSVVQGSSTTFTVNTQVTSGGARPVALSASGLPAGATATFNPSSVPAGGSSTLTVATTTSAATGTFTLTIRGDYTAPPATHTTTVTLTVTPLPAPDDFSVTAAPSSQGVLQGSGTGYTVTTKVVSGNAQTVTLSLAGLPAGASGTFTPASVTAGGSATLDVTTSTSTPAGTFTLTITGAYVTPPTTHSTTVTLTVNAPVVDDFSLTATPASQTVVQGQSTSYTVTTQLVSGNAQTVTFSVSGLPAGATGGFSPSAVTAGGSATLTVTTTTTAATGTVTLTITGTYPSSTTHSASVTFTVTPLPPDEFSISASPLARTVTQGASATYTVSTQVTSGNAQSVSLSVSGLPVDATGTFSPTTVTAGGSAVLTVTTTGTTAVATYALTITGTGAAGPTHSTTVSLDVQPAPSGPAIGVSWNGQFESDLAPPDPTDAMGPNSYMQLINLRYGIYARDSRLIQQGDLGMLTRFPVTELSDPQIVWDPTSQRFYYLVLDFVTNAFAFGYSKTDNPQSDDEFCHYVVDAFYGGSFFTPDYPKLAVTRDFVLIGSNVFLLLSFYVGSDVNWFVKPTDPLCPAQLGQGGTFQNIHNADGSQLSTPEPVVALDASSGGWVVGSNDVSTSGGADYLTVLKVTRNAQGQAQMSAPLPVTVPRYTMPANAPQSGTTQLIDTMDTRLTHAVAGYDPRINATAIWTAHTVFGGAGAEVRWFEISTAATPSLSQNGVVSDAELFVFNGAISSDRAADDVTATSAVTGGNMVMGFNTSSATTFSAIKMVSQRGAAPQSGVVLVQQSVGPYVDAACGSSMPNVCRWGDYAGAYADPLVSSGGQVWLSNEWNEPMTDGATPTWRTWNWSARP